MAFKRVIEMPHARGIRAILQYKINLSELPDLKRDVFDAFCLFMISLVSVHQKNVGSRV